MSNADFLAEATARGFVFQCTDTEALDAALRAAPITAYIGFDCTADSLHVGSLVQIMILRLLQKHGHRPVVLLGGGTTRIGDPSGKDESRQLLTDAQIAANMAGIRRCFDPFLRFGDGPGDALLANNADWLDPLGYIPLLRDVGTHFTINRMLTFDSVKLRLEREHPLTFLEFNYMILQSYDFRELSRRLGVVLQIGGSDQWGNIVAGIELARRTDAVSLFALTTPLITTASDIRTTFARHGGALEARVGEPAEARLDWRPATTVPLDEGQAAGGMTLLDALEASDDVQNMYANYEISEPVMAALSA